VHVPVAVAGFSSGSTSCKDTERFGGGVLFPIFTIEFPVGSPTEKYFLFVCENMIRFPLHSPIRCFFDDIFNFKIEKLAKV